MKTLEAILLLFTITNESCGPAWCIYTSDKGSETSKVRKLEDLKFH